MKLSIVTPTLNAAEFVEKNIESIDKLDIDIEHILVDGGSTDGTLEIIEKSLSDRRELIHQKDNKGMYSALQMGFMEANGDLFAYINADDKVIKEGFEQMYNIVQNREYDLVYSDGYFYWLEQKRFEKRRGRRFCRYHLQNGFMPFLQPSSIYSRDIFEEVGGFRYDKFKIAGDLDLFQRMALQKDFRAKYVPVSSTIFLKYGNSLFDNNIDLYYTEIEKLCRKNRSILNRIFFKLSELF